ncbi:MAG: transposase [Beijerinckiaceae bacterium]
MANNICGVDVSKGQLDACFGCDGTFASFENSVDGIAGLLAACRERGVDLVAMEATGNLHVLAFLLLSEGGVPCGIANPRAIRR